MRESTQAIDKIWKPQAKLILNPKYRMRKERNNVILYQVDWWGLMEKHHLIHPLYAIMLSLFDGKTIVKDIEEQFTYITNTTLYENGKNGAKHLISTLFSQLNDDILVESTPLCSRNSNGYKPDFFIINKKEIKVDKDNLRLGAPLDLTFHMTFKCYRHCQYCYAENEFAPRMTELSLEKMKEILDEARDLEINGIVFDGGEPFFKKNFVDILEHTISNGLSHCVSTKAFLNRSLCRRLRDIGLNKIQVSVDAIDKKIANFLTGSLTFYDEIMQTVDNLLANDIEIRIKSVVTPYNIANIPDLISFFMRKNIKHFQMVSYGRSIFRHDRRLFLSTEQHTKLKEKVNGIKEKNFGLDISLGGDSPNEKNLSLKEKAKRFKNRAICSAGRSSMNILPDGKVNFCEQIPSKEEFYLGDLKRQSLLEVWNSDMLMRFLLPEREKYQNTVCYDCVDFEECTRVRGRCYRNAYHVFGDVFAPDPACPKAKVNFRFS